VPAIDIVVQDRLVMQPLTALTDDTEQFPLLIIEPVTMLFVDKLVTQAFNVLTDVNKPV
jgi:hypothetical protein